jgi:nucleotide-binding universal stress UspA family protein
MFEKILLPLDGSELAEAAIPYVRDLAEQLNAEIFILHVCPPEHQRNLHMHQIYMNSIAEGMKKEARPDIKINAEVVIGDPSKIITDYAKLKEIDLVVITTHGISGFRPWTMGDVADKVVRGLGIPTLLVRNKDVPAVQKKHGVISKILLPLDNSEASKASLPYAIQLAKKLNAGIILFSRAQTIYAQNLDGINNTMGGGGGLGVNWDSVDAATEKTIDDYLQTIEDKIKSEGVEATHTSYLGIDAAYEILEMEKRTQADLVVMATRGRSPVARWAFGSVAEKVLREGNLPILLIKEKST